MIGRTIRRLATASIRPVYNVAIVGTGPAGFYTAHQLIKKSENWNLNVHLYDRNPTPFGLSRYGVAPDHPEVKNCEEYLDDLMKKYSSSNGSHQVKFFGNVDVGNDVSLTDLQQEYHSVVLLYGCTSGDKKLDIPGIDQPNVISARQFVNWYNGHPDCHGKNNYTPPALDSIENVTIIGNGNVALDIARILLVGNEHWAKTDISQEALDLLNKSTVKHVDIVARRGILESAYSNKEIRELLELSKGDLGFIPIENDILDPIVNGPQKLGRIDKRRVSLLEKYSKNPNLSAKRSWSLRYLRGPKEILQENGSLSSTLFSINEVVEGKVVTTEATEEIKSDLVILSIGYQGSPLSEFSKLGLIFEGNKIKNNNGRALSISGESIPGWYTSGWIKTGPKGVIATTMEESFITADLVIEDLSNNVFTEGDQALKNGHIVVDGVSWDQWLKINEYELSAGEKVGRPRIKLETREELLAVAN